MYYYGTDGRPYDEEDCVFEIQVIKIYINSGKKSIPQEQPNQNKKNENCRLCMRENEKWNISHAPSTSLRVIQFPILNVLESLIPKDQKKYKVWATLRVPHSTVMKLHVKVKYLIEKKCNVQELQIRCVLSL